LHQRTQADPRAWRVHGGACRRHKKAAGSGQQAGLVGWCYGRERLEMATRRPAVVAEVAGGDQQGLGGAEPIDQDAGAQRERRPHVGNRSIEASCILASRLAAASCTPDGSLAPRANGCPVMSDGTADDTRPTTDDRRAPLRHPSQHHPQQSQALSAARSACGQRHCQRRSVGAGDLGGRRSAATAPLALACRTLGGVVSLVSLPPPVALAQPSQRLALLARLPLLERARHEAHLPSAPPTQRAQAEPRWPPPAIIRPVASTHSKRFRVAALIRCHAQPRAATRSHGPRSTVHIAFVLITMLSCSAQCRPCSPNQQPRTPAAAWTHSTPLTHSRTDMFRTDFAKSAATHILFCPPMS
jgi:hypothetical protein